jgi:hypothetical protein
MQSGEDGARILLGDNGAVLFNGADLSVIGFGFGL